LAKFKRKVVAYRAKLEEYLRLVEILYLLRMGYIFKNWRLRRV